MDIHALKRQVPAAQLGCRSTRIQTQPNRSLQVTHEGGTLDAPEWSALSLGVVWSSAAVLWSGDDVTGSRTRSTHELLQRSACAVCRCSIGNKIANARRLLSCRKWSDRLQWHIRCRVSELLGDDQWRGHSHSFPQCQIDEMAADGNGLPPSEARTMSMGACGLREAAIAD